ncbi:MAG: hypothetical protein RMN53_17745 [Anaerolineae bacterium]|nr:hypothetical protein [Myxococcota bacterium]MDW8319673.1 hypothetical protein [Anaerolineae bacterium]
MDTDGIDGSSDLAGAVAWPAMARLLAPAVEEALRLSDSASLFGELRCWASGAHVGHRRVAMR